MECEPYWLPTGIRKILWVLLNMPVKHLESLWMKQRKLKYEGWSWDFEKRKSKHLNFFF